MASLIQHADAIREEFIEALGDKRVSFSEVLQLTGVLVGAAACTLDRLQSEAELGNLIAEAEALYDELLDPAEIDIPRVPEWAESYVIGLGKQFLRPAIERLADALEGVE